ncbi:MAG TPA: tyrosine-type recombinase/integrase [Acidimicrobiales bacterium]|nr:tyrosine-type recombinase/integrase [Acidimicrobiales bacterium]
MTSRPLFELNSPEHREVLARYRLHQVRRDLTETSVTCIQGHLRAYLRYLEAEEVPVFEATWGQVETFLDRRRTAKGQALSGRTRYYWISNVHSFYAWAIGEGLTSVDPTAAIIRPKMRRILPRPIDGEALSDAIRGAEPQMRGMLLLAALAALAALAGLRVMEIAGLERDDIIEAKGRIRVRNGKGRKERIVPLHPQALGALRTLPMPRSGYLFMKPMGGRHTPVSVSVAICVYLRDECGIDATAHQLRHWFATEIYASSKDIRVTQEMLGHSNPATTAAYVAYSHVGAAEAVSSLSIPGTESEDLDDGEPDDRAKRGET